MKDEILIKMDKDRSDKEILAEGNILDHESNNI